MALTADRNYETSGLTEKLRVLLTQNDEYYKGAIIVLTAAGGLAKVASNAAAEGKVSGVMTKHVSVAAGITTTYAEIEVGKVWIPLAGAAQSDVGDYIYATDDATIAKAGAGDAIGKAVDFKTGFLLVDLRCGVPATAL